MIIKQLEPRPVHRRIRVYAPIFKRLVTRLRWPNTCDNDDYEEERVFSISIFVFLFVIHSAPANEIVSESVSIERVGAALSRKESERVTRDKRNERNDK